MTTSAGMRLHQPLEDVGDNFRRVRTDSLTVEGFDPADAEIHMTDDG